MKPTEEKTRSNPSDLPVYLFKQGNNCEAYRYFGAHIEQRAGETGDFVGFFKSFLVEYTIIFSSIFFLYIQHP